MQKKTLGKIDNLLRAIIAYLDSRRDPTLDPSAISKMWDEIEESAGEVGAEQYPILLHEALRATIRKRLP